MKKMILMSAAVVALGLAAVSCGNKDKEADSDTVVVGEVVGEVVDMPESGNDTAVIAEGEAIAVEPVADTAK